MANIILETERLRVETIEEDHFGDLYKLLSNERVCKYFPKVLNEIESKEFLKKFGAGIELMVIAFGQSSAKLTMNLSVYVVS